MKVKTKKQSIFLSEPDGLNVYPSVRQSLTHLVSCVFTCTLFLHWQLMCAVRKKMMKWFILQASVITRPTNLYHDLQFQEVDLDLMCLIHRIN